MNAKNELAKDRTDLAEDRTSLANERTFAGWMRTGMASIGVALGLKAVFREFEPTWIAKAVASLFILAAILIFISASKQASKTKECIQSHSAEKQSSKQLNIIVVVMITGAVLTGVILWLL